MNRNIIRLLILLIAVSSTYGNEDEVQEQQYRKGKKKIQARLTALRMAGELKSVDDFSSGSDIHHVVEYDQKGIIAHEKTIPEKKSSTTTRSVFDQLAFTFISSGVKSALKHRDAFLEGNFIEGGELVLKDISISMVIRGGLQIVGKKYKTLSQMGLFIIANAYACTGKTMFGCFQHLVKETVKMIGNIILGIILTKLIHRIVPCAVSYGVACFIWDYLTTILVSYMLIKVH